VIADDLFALRFDDGMIGPLRFPILAAAGRFHMCGSLGQNGLWTARNARLVGPLDAHNLFFRHLVSVIQLYLDAIRQLAKKRRAFSTAFGQFYLAAVGELNGLKFVHGVSFVKTTYARRRSLFLVVNSRN
jgi:hypothetical protein